MSTDSPTTLVEPLDTTGLPEPMTVEQVRDSLRSLAARYPSRVTKAVYVLGGRCECIVAWVLFEHGYPIVCLETLGGWTAGSLAYELANSDEETSPANSADGRRMAAAVAMATPEAWQLLDRAQAGADQRRSWSYVVNRALAGSDG